MERMEENTTEVIKIKTKNKRNKCLRKRQHSSDEEIKQDSDEDISNKLQEMKNLQKLRERQNGVSIVSLALGKKISLEQEVVDNDPFRINSGGMIDMKSLKSGKIKTSQDDPYDTGIGTQFSAETNKRDEDEEMMKYIEVELHKRKGQEDGTDKDREPGENSKYFSPEEAALSAVPDHLRASSTQRSEEMLSNQMLSGIPEVDLGIEAKIKNIEATEEAKIKLLWEKQHKNEAPSSFVPTNMAVNFVQHNRFNIEDPDAPRRKKNKHRPALPVHHEINPTNNPPADATKGGKRDNTEKATDDYHYERFKKQFRRY